MNEANRLSAMKHRDAKLERSKRYEAENAAARKAYRAEWRKKNADRLRVQNAKYRAANKERRAQAQREWQAANPEKVRQYVLERVARRKNATTYVITDKDWRRLLSSPCAMPGCTNTDIEVDHIIPLSRGGSHGIANLQTLCRHHNRTKHSKLWIEYRAHLARLLVA
jgi:5-methylcytosine-specific restriction endonuclease McrA